MSKKRTPWLRNKGRKRYINIRDIKETFLILCEGEQTEVNYFNQFRLSSASVKSVGVGRSSYKLLLKALQIIKNGKEHDQYWLVFDRDEETNSVKQIKDSFLQAKKENVKIALSNPCFELWYALHYKKYNNAVNAKDLIKLLKKEMKGYNKKSSNHYEELISKQDIAIKNANDLFTNYSDYIPEKANPSTTVFQLVEELIKYKG